MLDNDLYYSNMLLKDVHNGKSINALYFAYKKRSKMPIYKSLKRNYEKGIIGTISLGICTNCVSLSQEIKDFGENFYLEMNNWDFCNNASRYGSFSYTEDTYGDEKTIISAQCFVSQKSYFKLWKDKLYVKEEKNYIGTNNGMNLFLITWTAYENSYKDEPPRPDKNIVYLNNENKKLFINYFKSW